MPQSRSALVLALAVAVALPTVVGGCVGALVVGGLAAAGGAGYAAGQERGVNGTASDLAIKNNIEATFMTTNPQLQTHITTTVYEGRVLLTGRVATPELKRTADQIAGGTKGVRATYDELAIAPPEQAWDDAKDTWITAEIRSKMVVDPAIRSVNYLVDTENGSVYLIGSARDQAELDRATQIARYVPGVRRVVSYVAFRPGVPAAVAAMPTAPSGAFAEPSAAAYSGAPIEQQKL